MERLGLSRENAIAIESEASDSLTYLDKSGFARKERNLYCDVHVAAENIGPTHIAAVWVSRLVLDQPIAAIQTSRPC